MMAANIAVVTVVIPFILIPTAVILLIFYLIRVVFIATSIDIKRFEAISMIFYSFFRNNTNLLLYSKKPCILSFNCLITRIDNHKSIWSSRASY